MDSLPRRAKDSLTCQIDAIFRLWFPAGLSIFLNSAFRNEILSSFWSEGSIAALTNTDYSERGLLRNRQELSDHMKVGFRDFTQRIQENSPRDQLLSERPGDRPRKLMFAQICHFANLSERERDRTFNILEPETPEFLEG